MTVRVILFFVTVAGLLLCNDTISLAQQSPIVLERADLLRTETGPNGPIRYLDGNVWITQDTLSVTCEHATYEEEPGRLFFKEDVHFVEPGRQIWADQAIYYERDGRATAEGNVRIAQDSLLIFCDRVVYTEAREEALFYGNVEIHSLPENAVMTGDHGIYNRPREHGVLTINPRMIRRFDETDSLVISGLCIEYFFAEKRAVVLDSVEVERGAFRAWGQELYYWDDQEHARLLGDPIIEHGRDVLTADTVDAYFSDKVLDRIILTGKAVATSPVDSLFPLPKNRMTGQRMEISFIEDEVDSIHVQGNATSTYFLREKGEKKGANRVSGDIIDIWISEGRIAWIYVEGGTEGVYYPQHLERRALADEEGLPVLGREP